ncbi:MAG: hypothetical protein K2K45_07600 [Muribaculaceae bacterium]|nr:hypothetical protein [Muribaculaceae bacterium]
MKTIEEKAKQRAFDITSSLWLNIPELIVAIHDLYIEAATEALAGQWRKSDDIEGLEDGEQVIVAVQRMDNSIKYSYTAYFHSGKFWYESNDSEVHFFNLWMRLPKPPKDKSQ